MALLLAFCALSFVSQTVNSKISNAKSGKASFAQPLKGSADSSGKENQPNPVNGGEEEEEDDEFGIEPGFSASSENEFVTVEYLRFRQNLNDDLHRKVISPPPQL